MFLSFLSISPFILLLMIFWSDLFHRRIYLWQVIGLVSVSIISHLLRSDLSISGMFVGGLIGAVFFGMQFMFSRGKFIGSGDVFLGIALGVLFGWSSLCFVILMAYVGGSIVSLVLLLMKQIQRTDPLPLGSFLSAAAMITLYLPRPWELLGLV